MSHVLAQQSRVESAMDEIAITETKSVVPEDSPLHPILLSGRNGFPLLQKGPVGFYPDRTILFGKDPKVSLRRIEAPTSSRRTQTPATAGRADGVQQYPFPLLEVEPILGGVDQDIGPLGIERLQLELKCGELVLEARCI